MYRNRGGQKLKTQSQLRNYGFKDGWVSRPLYHPVEKVDSRAYNLPIVFDRSQN